MRKGLCGLVLVLALIHPALWSDTVKPTEEEMALARRWAAAGSDPFFSFIYGGQNSKELLGDWKFSSATSLLDRGRSERTLTWTDPKTGLSVRCLAVVYSDFPTVEWTVYLKNAGSADTPIIEDLQALDADFWNGSGREFLLHHSVGSPCQPNDFQPLETTLGPGAEKRISAKGGRPTNSDMSYFNLEWQGGGMILAVGWPGQWSASFKRDRAGGLRVRAGQELTHFKLHPGEEVRTPLIVLQFWRGDWLRSQNIWRRWMIAHNLPRPDGRALPPHFDSCWGNMKPTAEEEIAMVQGFARERIKLDYWILDAGWYPNGEWWDNVGTWTPDPTRFPKGLRPVADAAHAAGVKFVVWFEPERVTPNSWLAANHRNWVLPRPDAPDGVPKLSEKKNGILNLGNPEAKRWLVDYLDRMFKTEGIDVLRTDFNIDPLDRWRENDAPDRQGITENHYVTGLLSYWDGLIARVPGRWIDTCASGGRRNDLETLRRAAPLLRSDYFEKPVGHQCHTYGLSLWLPWYGSGTRQADPYLVRSSICPAWRIGLDMRKRDNDYDALRKHVADFRTISPNLMGDYYPLTPYSLEDGVWMAFQFDRPEAGTGTVMAFRRAKCEEGSLRFKLSGLQPEARYDVTDLDSPKPERFTGAELMDRGIPVTVPAKPGAALLVYRRQSGMDAAAAEKTRYQGTVAIWYGSHFEATDIHDWKPIRDWNGPFHPLLGEYKTSDPEAVRQHLRWLRRAGVDVIFYDVCRIQPELTLFGLPQQKTLQLIVDELSRQDKETRKLQLALWLEKWNSNPTAAEYRSGLEYVLKSLGPSKPYYRLEGKPLVVTYLNSTSPDIDSIDREYEPLLTIRRLSPYPGVKGWKYFGPEGDKECMTVNPGADGFMEEAFIAEYVHKKSVDVEALQKRGKAAIEQRADGAYFERQLLKAREVDPKLIFISGWNDWAWCLQIEPAKEYGFLYVDLTARLLGREAETRPYR